MKEKFALLNIVKQLGIVLLVSSVLVLLSSVGVDSIKTSYLLFMDPTSIPNVVNYNVALFIFSFVVMITGVVITGFIISILSSFLEETLRDIRNGKLNYYGKNHTLIVNINHEIYNILNELELLHEDSAKKHDIIVLSANEEDIKNLLDYSSEQAFENINLYIRFGDTLSLQRYYDLAVLNLFAIIILSDSHIENLFERDNVNLRIINLLMAEKKIKEYFLEKKENKVPVKAVVEFSKVHHIDSIVAKASENLFFPIAPKKILSYILNLSVIDMDFYTAWNELLTFDGHEIYFVDPEKLNILNLSYKDVVLRQEKGVIIGISRVVDGEFTLLLNPCGETVKKGDWVIFIALDRGEISIADSTPNLPQINYDPIEQPKEIFARNILMFGNHRKLFIEEFLDLGESDIFYRTPEYNQLFEEDFIEHQIKETGKSIDTVILNYDNESTYRLALHLATIYTQEQLSKFIFIVDDSIIAKHLENSGFVNTILSHLLVSRFISQVSNQLTLNKVILELTNKEGAEINFLTLDKIDSKYLENLNTLKMALVLNNMTYIGIVDRDSRVIFDAKDALQEAQKIIVVSDGEF